MHEEFRNSLKRCYWNDGLLLYANKKQSMPGIEILKRIFLK